MKSIVIYHTAAIGDSILALPVSLMLKKAFPDARINYIAHESIVALLSLCPSIDGFIPYTDQPVLELRKAIQELHPDLIVDLSNSMKSISQTVFLAKNIVRYKKDPAIHAVDNFLGTIASICETSAENYFPCMFPPEDMKEKMRKILPQEGRRYLALVPGVGTLRPHRAWPEDNWVALAKHILWEKDHSIVLIGGPDERTLCSRIAEKIGENCYNFAGKLSLVETATVFSMCDGTVASDTGPAHLSIACDTPVVGLYGPTLMERSGPYGCDGLTLTVSDKCKCLNRKTCSLQEGSGFCMKEIPMKLVYGNLSQIFPWNRV